MQLESGQLKEIIRDEMKPNYLFDGVKKTETIKALYGYGT
jgi:hypothetical protein